MAFCMGSIALCFGLRQVLSSVAPGWMKAMGLGWLIAVPAAPAQLDTDTHDCTLSWWRSGFSSLSYSLVCTAEDEDIEVEEIHLAVIDAADWRSGAWTNDRTSVYTYEEQWPLSGEETRIDAGRRWEYTGTMAAGAADFLGGEPRALVWRAVIDLPDLDDSEVRKICGKPSGCSLELASAEPPRDLP